MTGNTARRLARDVSHAGKTIGELQDLTMSPRMVPLKGTFQKMARLARDLGRKSGKNIRQVLQRLPVDTPGTVIVQHMPDRFTAAFAERLNGLCAMQVREARSR